jgi:hypothetical protein
MPITKTLRKNSKIRSKTGNSRYIPGKGKWQPLDYTKKSLRGRRRKPWINNRIAHHITFKEALDLILFLSYGCLTGPEYNWFYKAISYKLKKYCQGTFSIQAVQLLLKRSYYVSLLETDDIYQQILLILTREIINKGFYFNNKVIVSLHHIIRIVALHLADWIAQQHLPRKINNLLLSQQQLKQQKDIQQITIFASQNNFSYKNLSLLDQYLLYLYYQQDLSIKTISKLCYYKPQVVQQLLQRAKQGVTHGSNNS